MANTKQQKKRNIQSEKKKTANSMVKSSVRTADKKVLKYLESKEGKEKSVIETLYKNFVRTIDTAAQKGVVKKNTASRKKSRVAKKVNTAISQIG